MMMTIWNICFLEKGTEGSLQWKHRKGDFMMFDVLHDKKTEQKRDFDLKLI